MFEESRQAGFLVCGKAQGRLFPFNRSHNNLLSARGADAGRSERRLQ
jgi:hypothetical protein